jgi:hypothetical protein
MGIKVAFLIDVNSLPSQKNWRENVACLEEFILDKLTEDVTFNKVFDASDLLWTYKFFNTSKPSNTSTGRRLFPFDLESHEAFEDALEAEMEAVYGVEDQHLPDDKSIKFLSTALQSLISDLPWAEESSINKSLQSAQSKLNARLSLKSSIRNPGTAAQLHDGSEKDCTPPSFYQASGLGQSSENCGGAPNRNYIYIFHRIPRTQVEVSSFVGNWTDAASSESYIKVLVGKAFFEELRKKSHIQLKFVDMAYYSDSVDTKWENKYPFPLQKVFSTLGNTGCLVPPLQLRTTGPGHPPWKILLLYALTACANPNVNSYPVKLPLAVRSIKRERDWDDSQTQQAHSGSGIDSTKKKLGGLGALVHGTIKTEYRLTLERENAKRKSLLAPGSDR